jgi:hypothetical protein
MKYYALVVVNASKGVLSKLLKLSSDQKFLLIKSLTDMVQTLLCYTNYLALFEEKY